MSRPALEYELRVHGFVWVLPGKYEVCPRCQGHGKHDHPALSNGITADEWNGPDWDDESRENYLNGVYDVVCEKCLGDRVVLVPDVARCTFSDKRLLSSSDSDSANAIERGNPSVGCVTTKQE